MWHQQTNGQVKTFNRTNLEGLHHYVTENRTDWDLYLDVVTYAYNRHIYRMIGCSQFDLVLSQGPPLLTSEPDPRDTLHETPEAFSTGRSGSSKAWSKARGFIYTGSNKNMRRTSIVVFVSPKDTFSQARRTPSAKNTSKRRENSTSYLRWLMDRIRW